MSTMLNTITVRAPVAADSARIAHLVTQLGYPALPSDIPERVERLASLDSAVLLVAEVDEQVVGVITAHMFPTVHAAAPAAWITALVVDESARGKKVGRALVD